MAPTVYLSRAAWECLDAAQAVFDRHAPGASGVCSLCLVDDPCPARSTAAARISRYGRLPRRRPGTQPWRPAAPEDPTFGWFDRSLVGAR